MCFPQKEKLGTTATVRFGPRVAKVNNVHRKGLLQGDESIKKVHRIHDRHDSYSVLIHEGPECDLLAGFGGQ